MGDIGLVILVGALWYFLWGPGKPKPKEDKKDKGKPEGKH